MSSFQLTAEHAHIVAPGGHLLNDNIIHHAINDCYSIKDKSKIKREAKCLLHDQKVSKFQKYNYAYEILATNFLK